MSRFDRYILSQLLTLFGFFALILVSVYWVNRAVSLFDQLIASGQNVSVFLELSVLTLPNVIRLVLPIAVFAGTVYVTNRLSSESELTVMQATGFSPWRLARPVAIFGVITALMLSALTHFLVPTSNAELSKRQKEITENVTARLLTDGTFLHPADGVTFYIREITPNGVLKDVFLADHRSEGRSTSYTASDAYLVQDESGPKLVMVDGLAQLHRHDTDTLMTTNFADFSYDISSLIDPGSAPRVSAKHFPSWEIIGNKEAIAQETGESIGGITEDLHDRFAMPLSTISFALIGFAMLLAGGFSRFGVWRQIIAAFVIIVILEAMKNAIADPVRANPELWPLMYVPSSLGFVIAGILLYLSANPIRWRRRAAT
ncbi:MAG: LPS export ABC transporter permease LptF [Shimia sp.]|uniref:LPS export ABC transporter permease LptF n=1 Tax=Shimia sp. TaxID=1954381 RepID=UPI0025D20E79|nr:LPS export ABC transporter permease LptF [Shimia sp.]MCH2066704.1 LPS export ABC transporter permease LptF [Shimia sp.]